MRRARLLLRAELLRHPNAVPLVVVVSDGLPTVPLRPGGDPVADLLSEGRALRRARVGVVVAEVASPAAGCAELLAEACGGTRLPLSDLAAEVVIGAVAEAT